jgi:hypothetical protein
MVEGDAHGCHLRPRVPQRPELREVHAEVRERVHRKHGHVQQVGDLDAPAMQPLVLVGLQLLQLCLLEAQCAQLPPREVLLLDVLPGQREDGLSPPAKELHADDDVFLFVLAETKKRSRAHPSHHCTAVSDTADMPPVPALWGLFFV